MPNKPESAPIADVNVDKWIKQFIICRDWVAKEEAAHKLHMKPVKTDMEMLKGRLQKFLDDTKQDGGKTGSGTFFKSTTYSASLEDAQAFMRHVIGSEDWDLLDKKANVTAVLDFAEKNKGQLPPGVKVTPKVDVNVRRPTEK